MAAREVKNVVHHMVLLTGEGLRASERLFHKLFAKR
jgi:hypothetical protein